MKDFYRSGEIAKICGCSPDTLRHYERLGLIQKPLRSENRYRKYPKEIIHRVKQIQAALRIGFTLKELSKIFRIRDLQEKIREMNATRQTSIFRCSFTIACR